jgi:hypothetical protein
MSMAELLSLKLNGSAFFKMYDPSERRGEEWKFAHCGLVTPNRYIDEDEGLHYTFVYDSFGRVSTASTSLKQYHFDRGVRVWFNGIHLSIY